MQQMICIKTNHAMYHLCKEPGYTNVYSTLMWEGQTKSTLIFLQKQISTGDYGFQDKEMELLACGFLVGYFGLPSQKLPKLKLIDYIPVPLVNKGLEYISFSNIFKDRTLQKLLPINRTDLHLVVVSYSYNKAFSTKLFNYTKELHDLTGTVSY